MAILGLVADGGSGAYYTYVSIPTSSQTPKEPHYITFLKVEEGLCVVITYILYHLADELYLACGE